MMISQVFSLLLFILLSSLLCLEVNSQCLSDQKSLLQELKNSLRFNTASKSNLPEWNSRTDCCDWDGVTCDEGRVIGLNLSGKSIIGGLENSTLFNLQHLKSLDLSHNSFDTRIPSRFANLTNLSFLNLSNAGFFGLIPIEISRLKSLIALDVSTGAGFRRAPLLKLEARNLLELVRSLVKLEELYLDGVNMSSVGDGWCRDLSSSVPNLRVLSLSGCSLSGPIDSLLAKLRSLSIIRLDRNNLSSLVPKSFATFSNLIVLSLSHCNLYGLFPKKIFQLPTLEIIDISGNRLLQGSLPDFSQNNVLRRLVLRSTSFSSSLPTSIGNLAKLSVMDISDCHFDGTLPNFMPFELVYLNLSNNKFTGTIPSFEMSKNLTEIVLSHNNFSGSIPVDHWEGLAKLLVIDLRNNSFSGSIPASLFSLPSLEQIQLSSNGFTGLVPEFTDPSSSMLSLLDLSRNNLEGPIPTSIFKLRKLTLLSLAFNKLNDTVHQHSISGLTSLKSLDLSYNKLSLTSSFFPENITLLKLARCNLRAFPDLKNLRKLVSLDLSSNLIHGLIPSWIWETGSGFLLHMNLSRNDLVGMRQPYALPSTLNTLDLNSNQIRGTIPVPPPSASFVDFSSNRFHSSIPSDFGNNLSSIIFLSLSNNSLTGLVPESICNTIKLQVLDFSSNRLSGRIPECLSTMSKTLLVLNLSGNRFSGQIPDSFHINCALMTLDVNGNSIGGQAPKSLTSCGDLKMLDLGNNNLSGEFPCFLKKLPKLRVLVLRYNKFHGRIGCSNTSETEERIQIIDLSHNNFSGELPRSIFGRWNAMIDNEENARAKLDHLLQVTVQITTKGREMHLVKILTVCTCIDFSSNRFHGMIPEEIGALTLLYSLNLSNNAFSGTIPPSLCDMRHLESLDLSGNNLSGEIPTMLGKLNFLSHLNLSFNKLVGRIPSGAQLGTFSADSFSNNAALCGFPLASDCANDEVFETFNGEDSNAEAEIDWNVISAEIGFGFGFGFVVVPLVFCKQWREYYYKVFEDIAFMMFPLAVTRKWLLWTTRR